jgi:tRNA threonylcarbamoyladenosine biosynthesis protein TsaE
LRAVFRSPGETRAAGQALARCLGAEGLCIALCGELGAGKTLFAQGLAEGLGIDPGLVTSPTFAIANAFLRPQGTAFVHVDLYRLASRDELEATGFADWFEPGAVIAVEWADRFPDALPHDRLQLTLTRDPNASGTRDDRVLNAIPAGPQSGAALERFRAAWAAIHA